MHACSVTKLFLTLCNPMDCNLPGSSVHGILQVRILEWVVISSSRGSSSPRDWACISCIGRRIFFFFFFFFTTEPSGRPIRVVMLQVISLHLALFLGFIHVVMRSCNSFSSLPYSILFWNRASLYCSITIHAHRGFSSVCSFKHS